MPATGQGKILVIRGGAIGDFILTLPVLAALRQQLPQAKLEVLGYAHIAQLALIGGLADAVHSIEARALAGFFAKNGTLDPKLQEFFSGFALIVSFLFDPDGIFQANVGRCSKAQFLTGPHRPDERGGIHATEVFLKPLERLAIFDADPVPALRFADPKSSPSGARPVLALHPGSGSERKNWPEQKWTELIPALARDLNFDLLLVGGEAEGDRLVRLADRVAGERLSIARNLPLRELARRLESCVGFVGHDSGITHLAAALGLPVLALWGDTVEAVWRPRSQNAMILRHDDGLRALSVEQVLQRVAELLPR